MTLRKRQKTGERTIKVEQEHQFSGVFLRCPDGRLAMQRRIPDVRYGAGLVGFFGGALEDGETPEQCIRRELCEETSLDVGKMIMHKVAEFAIEPTPAYEFKRRFHMYESMIADASFYVYEGTGPEYYSMDELAQRTDLVTSARYALMTVTAEQG